MKSRLPADETKISFPKLRYQGPLGATGAHYWDYKIIRELSLIYKLYMPVQPTKSDNNIHTSNFYIPDKSVSLQENIVVFLAKKLFTASTGKTFSVKFKISYNLEKNAQ